jgi:hypothetical protein
MCDEKCENFVSAEFDPTYGAISAVRHSSEKCILWAKSKFA